MKTRVMFKNGNRQTYTTEQDVKDLIVFATRETGRKCLTEYDALAKMKKYDVIESAVESNGRTH